VRCDRTGGDPVEKQVFADCPDRGTTAAVGGKLTFATGRTRATSAVRAPI
jgi:hypothetical protein